MFSLLFALFLFSFLHYFPPPPLPLSFRFSLLTLRSCSFYLSVYVRNFFFFFISLVNVLDKAKSIISLVTNVVVVVLGGGGGGNTR